MRPVLVNDELYYFEESTGYLYLNKGLYYIPLNYTTLDCKPLNKQKNGTNTSIKTKAVQKYRRPIQLRRQPKQRVGSKTFRPRHDVRDRTQRRVKIHCYKSMPGACTVYKGHYRPNCVHSILRTSPPILVHGIRPKVRTNNRPI